MTGGYLRFDDVPQTTPRRTRVVAVMSVRSGERLATIKWFGRWRQYTFFAEPDTVWNHECLREVIEHVDAMNLRHRNQLAEARRRQTDAIRPEGTSWARSPS